MSRPFQGLVYGVTEARATDDTPLEQPVPGREIDATRPARIGGELPIARQKANARAPQRALVNHAPDAQSESVRTEDHPRHQSTALYASRDRPTDRQRVAAVGVLHDRISPIHR